MISTLLCDLDNTLLANDMRRFLRAYLALLGEHLAASAEPERMVEALMAGTQAMLANERPERTLRQVFDEVFYPSLHLDPQAVRGPLEDFYVRHFPELRIHTQPVAMAPELVRLAFERKWKVAVVTNPLFPRTAIEQRLDWAGLSPRANPFDLITSYEESHFAKPHPEYFAEALAYLGSQPEEALLVGDDLEMDIRPAQRLGLRTFWVRGETHRSGDGRLSAGSLADLYEALLEDADKCGQINPPDPMALPHVLRGHLGAVLTAFARSAAWSIGPLDADWSPTEIACHLRDVEREITQPRIEMLTRSENPFLPAVESDLWAEQRNYRAQDGPAALQAFVEARSRTVELLHGLPPQTWQRPGRHAIFGPTTLAEQVSFIARHDMMHLDQMHARPAD